ncbi:MAG: metallophosphoesterase [Myxococcales bacterium]|nr:metallophosphoesterase [Myxococcales bacterium]
MRRLIVGDVHGCLEELDALLALARPEEVIFVGDLVAKGPDSLGVIRRARELGARSVLGNHDAHCLRARAAAAAGRPSPKLKRTHREVCEQLGEADWAWLEALPMLLRLPEEGALVVHAGLRPDRSLEAQDPEDLMMLRSLREDGSPSSRVDEGVPWASRWPGPERVFFGHDALRGLQRHPHALGLDTGCVYGGALSGFVLPEEELVQVPAARAYLRPRGPSLRHALGSRGRLRPGRVEAVSLAASGAGTSRRALLVLDASGRAHAYLDECKHLPISLGDVPRALDGIEPQAACEGRAAFDRLDASGEHLICQTHGAVYRLEDGVCVEGPCVGASLDAFHLEEIDGELFLMDRPPQIEPR